MHNANVRNDLKPFSDIFEVQNLLLIKNVNQSNDSISAFILHSLIFPCNWLPFQSLKMNMTSIKIIHFFGILSHLINPLLTKLIRSRWLDIGLVFCKFMDLDFAQVHKHAKKNLTDIQPLRPHTWSITHIYQVKIAKHLFILSMKSKTLCTTLMQAFNKTIAFLFWSK